jgi:hypothetical protein
MDPLSFDTLRKIPYTVQVSVTGRDNAATVGQPQITDSAFTRALVESIKKSELFNDAVVGHDKRADYLLSVTIFSVDKRTFGRTVRLDAGWTLRSAATKAIVGRNP